MYEMLWKSKLARTREMKEKYDLSLKVDRFIGRAEERARNMTPYGKYWVPRRLRAYLEARATYVRLRQPVGNVEIGDVSLNHAINKIARNNFSWKHFDEGYGGSHLRLLDDTELDRVALYLVMERDQYHGVFRGLAFAEEKKLDVVLPLRYGAFELPLEKLLSAVDKGSLKIDALCPHDYFQRTSDDFT